jgi:hypothetical protein
MSQFDERIGSHAIAADEASNPCANDKCRRFTPLRSHANRARILTQDKRILTQDKQSLRTSRAS